MKHQGFCTKCGSKDVARIPGRLLDCNCLPVGSDAVAVDRWVCCSCGYCEAWIRKEDLKHVKEWWL